jgi:hypothetical protein
VWGKDLLEQTLGEDLMALGAARNSLGRVGRRLTQLCRVVSVSPPICRHLPNPKHEGLWTREQPSTNTGTNPSNATNVAGRAWEAPRKRQY